MVSCAHGPEHQRRTRQDEEQPCDNRKELAGMSALRGFHRLDRLGDFPARRGQGHVAVACNRLHEVATVPCLPFSSSQSFRRRRGRLFGNQPLSDRTGRQGVRAPCLSRTRMRKTSRPSARRLRIDWRRHIRKARLWSVPRTRCRRRHPSFKGGGGIRRTAETGLFFVFSLFVLTGTCAYAILFARARRADGAVRGNGGAFADPLQAGSAWARHVGDPLKAVALRRGWSGGGRVSPLPCVA